LITTQEAMQDGNQTIHCRL